MGWGRLESCFLTQETCSVCCSMCCLPSDQAVFLLLYRLKHNKRKDLNSPSMNLAEGHQIAVHRRGNQAPPRHPPAAKSGLFPPAHTSSILPCLCCCPGEHHTVWWNGHRDQRCAAVQQLRYGCLTDVEGGTAPSRARSPHAHKADLAGEGLRVPT